MPKRRGRGEGSLILRPGMDIYYAQWYVNGRAVRKSTGTNVKQEALAKLRDFMQRTDNGAPVPDGKLRFSDLRAALIEDYTDKGNRSLEVRADGTETVVGLPQLEAYCGYQPAKDGQPEEPGCKVSSINVEWVRKFKTQRQEQGAGPAMINRSLQCLRRGLNLLRESGKLAVVPKIKLMEEPAARKGFTEQTDFENLMRALPSYLRPLIALLYYTGVRKGEALSIQWDQVDLDGGTIALDGTQTKNGEPRILPVPAEVLAYLRPIQPKHGQVFDATNLRIEWEKACDAAGLGKRVKVEGPAYDWYHYKGLRLHDLRRSAVRNLVRAGVSQKVAMDISGHKTAHVFQRYNISSTSDVLAAMRAVEVRAAQALPPAKPARRRSVQLSVQAKGTHHRNPHKH